MWQSTAWDILRHLNCKLVILKMTCTFDSVLAVSAACWRLGICNQVIIMAKYIKMLTFKTIHIMYCRYNCTFQISNQSCHHPVGIHLKKVACHTQWGRLGTHTPYMHANARCFPWCHSKEQLVSKKPAYKHTNFKISLHTTPLDTFDTTWPVKSYPQSC